MKGQPKRRFWYVSVTDGDLRFEHIFDGWKPPSAREWNPDPDQPAALMAGHVVRDRGYPVEVVERNDAWVAWKEAQR